MMSLKDKLSVSDTKPVAENCDWQDVRLGDLCTRITKGTTPTTVGYAFSSSGVHFIKSECIADGRVNPSKGTFISKETHQALKRSILNEGDVLFSMAGVYIGKTAVVTKEILPANTNQAVGIIRLDRTKADCRYVGYYLRQKHYNQYVNSLVAQSAQPNLNLAEIGNLPIRIPNLPEQKRIADILGSLDDKIELNRKMNETLEAMARVLFKSWFVDFDPVVAKSEGRQPEGMDAETAKLFPDSFEESEIGRIPKGWKVLGLDDIADYLNGLALQKYPAEDDSESLPVVKIAQLRTGNTDGADRANSTVPTAYIVHDGDVLFSWSGSLTVVLWCGGIGALNQHLFKVTSAQFPKWFFYLWTQHHLPDFQNIAADKATTMGHIQRHHLTAAKVIVPPPKLLDAIGEHIAPLIDVIICHRIESRTLASTRDALLPRLLSGELAVATD